MSQNHLKVKPPILSIVIPYYNTPLPFLVRAVESIKCSDMSEIEVIIVDDGSEIKNADFLDRTYGEVRHITVIHQDNAGVSSARNCGIKIARGKYVAFLDDDDYFFPEFINEALGRIRQNDIDILIGGYAKETSGECLSYSTDRECFFENDGIVEVFKSLSGIRNRTVRYRIPGTVWGKVFRMDLVRKTMFEEHLAYGEDLLFTRKVVRIARTVLVCPSIWYFYSERDGSAIKRISYIELFENDQAYREELFKMIRDTPENISDLFIIDIFSTFDAFAHSVCLDKTRDLHDKCAILQRARRTETIDEAIKVMYTNGRQLSARMKLLVYLAVHERYISYLACKKIGYLVHKR